MMQTAKHARRVDWVNFLKFVPKPLWQFGLVIMAVWLIKACILDDIPAFLPKAYELGKVVDGLFAAVVSGWVFYLIFSELPTFTEREPVRKEIFDDLTHVIGDCKHIIGFIQNAAPGAFDYKNASDGEYSQLFDRLPTKSTVALVDSSTGQMTTWIPYFVFQQGRTHDWIANLEKLGRFYDSDLADILTRIDKNVFFTMCNMTDHGITNLTLEAFGPSFKKYVCQIIELVEWYNSNRRQPEPEMTID